MKSLLRLLLCTILGVHGDGPADLYTRMTWDFEVIDSNKGTLIYTCDLSGKRWLP